MCVGIAENARIPVDNPATHLELTMVHEAMVLEYSGRHLAMIEAAAQTKLVLYFSLIICLFRAVRHGDQRSLAVRVPLRHGRLSRQAIRSRSIAAIAETSVAKMRVFRYPVYLGGAFAAAALAVFLLFVSRGF